MKNMLLAYPADWFVVPETLAAAKASILPIETFYIEQGLVDPAPNALTDIIKEPLKEVYTVPLLSEQYCKLLLDEVKSMHFIPNPDEDVDRQMPEVILNTRLPYAYSALNEVVKLIINPILTTIWVQAAEYAHIQVANYNPREKKQGAWHHDEDADITIVVPLNTGEYVGGGTEFQGRGIVEPLPNGHALIFPALTHMHRGLPVESGDRYLLVFWLKIERGGE